MRAGAGRSDRDDRGQRRPGGGTEKWPATLTQQHLLADKAFNVYSRHCGVGRARVETGHYFRRNPNRVRGPDVFYWINAPRCRDTRTRSFVFGVPNIVVEVVSHSDSATNPQPKVREYLEAGSNMVWVV